MPPLALIVSAIAMARNQNRKAALAGILVSGLCVLLVFGFPLLVVLCG